MLMSSSSESSTVQYPKESGTEEQASEPEFEKPETSNYVYRWADRKGLPSGAYGTIYVSLRPSVPCPAPRAWEVVINTFDFQRVPRKRYDDDTGKAEIVAVKAVRIHVDEESPQPDPREISALSFLNEYPHKNIVSRKRNQAIFNITFWNNVRLVRASC